MTDHKIPDFANFARLDADERAPIERLTADRDHYKARADALLRTLESVLLVAEEQMEPSQQHVHPDNRDGGEAYAEYLMRQSLLAARARITRINQEDSERG